MHCFGWSTDGRRGFQWGAGLLGKFRPREDKRTFSDINTVISFKLNLTASRNIPFSPKQLSLFLQTVRTASGQFGPSVLWYGSGTGRQAERGGCEAAFRIGVRTLCTYGSWVDSP